jgi:hypothetical protein
MKFNWKKLYEHLDSLRAGESWRHLAAKSSLTPSIFTRISQGKPTSVRNLLKLLAMQDKGIEHYIDKKGTK